ncbi:MAG: hypothetical protein ACREIU_05295 [Planctomycetota bacterium]
MACTLPVHFLPTPTRASAESRRQQGLLARASPLPIPIPIPLPSIRGARVLTWRQDPSVGEIGIRKAYLPNRVLTGPRDARIATQGLPAVTPNALGDLIVDPVNVDAFDAVHTFAVVRQTLTFFQRLRREAEGNPNAVLPWQWNSPGNSDPLAVHPHAGVTANAFYSRTQKALKFFYFTPPGSPPGAPQVFTCRSLDIVAHETGHTILDGLQPSWLLFGNPPQTGGLHESFGDLAAIFLILSQLDQVEAIVAQTKANLHAKNFLAELAEQFGNALGRPNGLRNADNDLKLSEVSTEVHAISQVFTGGIYDVLADLFADERKPHLKDDAQVLYEAARYLGGLLLRGLIAAPASAATYFDVVKKMMEIATLDARPKVRQSLVKRFVFREVLPAGTTLAPDARVTPFVQDAKGAVQDRTGCCGTMQLEEYLVEGVEEEEDLVREQRGRLMAFLGDGKGRGRGDGVVRPSPKAGARTRR